MSSIVSFLLAPRHQGKVRFALWALCFVLLVGAGGWFAMRELRQSMDDEVGRVMQTYANIRVAMVSTLDIMDRQLTAPPCSAEYAQQQRRVAFLPDGMNELFFFDNNRVVCTANKGLLPKPVDLGPPDIVSSTDLPVSLWLSRDLASIGLPGLRGSLATRGNQGIVVPITPVAATASQWLELEVVIRAQDGRWWHTSGVEGLYAQAMAPPNGPLGLNNGALTTTLCDPGGLHCLAARASLGDLLTLGSAIVVAGLIVCAIMATWLSARIHALLARRWSFESRFLRRLQSRGLGCAYQPLLDIERDRVTGCEVLARWRDVDGTLIYPDRFIPIIEAHGLTRAFTRLIVERAYADLFPLVAEGQRLQVNFNIFPQDLDAELILEMFAPFIAPGSPFDLVIEIVETGAVEFDTAQVAIERLRAEGISVYIDDFGAGYSSMHTLAGLSVDGVKLDRSFAMAPDGSVMARLLEHAIDMVQASGRKVVVEGVETAARLAWLKAGGKVDLAQGYYISRPVERDAFQAILEESCPGAAARPRLVA